MIKNILVNNIVGLETKQQYNSDVYTPELLPLPQVHQ